MNTVWDSHHNVFQLDREREDVAESLGAWVPKKNIIGNWIQVSTEDLK
jgi:hypothetical protein